LTLFTQKQQFNSFTKSLSRGLYNEGSMLQVEYSTSLTPHAAQYVISSVHRKNV